MKFQALDKVGDIVSRFPKAADIFHNYKIDYCCGGHRSLKEVTKDQNINLNDLIFNLEDYYNKMSVNTTTDWNKAPYDQLVNHILQEHHAFLHTNLPIIGEHIKTILRVHGGNHPELMALYQNFQQLKTELEMHLIKEETIQYPAIEAYLQSHKKEDLKKAILVIDDLEDEHEVAGSLLKTINQLTNNYQRPEDGCETFDKTYQMLDQLEKNTFTHIHLENNILFIRLKEEI